MTPKAEILPTPISLKQQQKTYQKTFKFFGLCDVDPTILLHHLNMFYFIVEPVEGRQVRLLEKDHRDTRRYAHLAPPPKSKALNPIQESFS